MLFRSDHVFTRLENWPRLIAVRDEVLKALEVARQQKLIRSGLEARVSLEVFNSDPLESSNDVAQLEQFRRLLDQYKDFLPALFIVSQVDILPGVSAASLERTSARGPFGPAPAVRVPGPRAASRVFRRGRARGPGTRTAGAGPKGPRAEVRPLLELLRASG